MSRALNDLDYRIKNLAFEFLARTCEEGIPACLVDTLRTPEEQQANIAKGVSFTVNSKHLAQPPDGKALAFDVAPYAIYQLHGPDKLQWDTNDPVWARYGKIGERLGLRWGGRWKTPHDPGHFEYIPLSQRKDATS
jgi:hypothetical protein